MFRGCGASQSSDPWTSSTADTCPTEACGSWLDRTAVTAVTLQLHPKELGSTGRSVGVCTRPAVAGVWRRDVPSTGTDCEGGTARPDARQSGVCGFPVFVPRPDGSRPSRRSPSGATMVWPSARSHTRNRARRSQVEPRATEETLASALMYSRLSALRSCGIHESRCGVTVGPSSPSLIGPP